MLTVFDMIYDFLKQSGIFLQTTEIITQNSFIKVAFFNFFIHSDAAYSLYFLYEF